MGVNIWPYISVCAGWESGLSSKPTIKPSELNNKLNKISLINRREFTKSLLSSVGDYPGEGRERTSCTVGEMHVDGSMINVNIWVPTGLWYMGWRLA